MTTTKSHQSAKDPTVDSSVDADAKSSDEENGIPADEPFQPEATSDDDLAQPEIMSADNPADAPKPRGRPFVPGQSGNPLGRPMGALGKKTLEAQAQLEEHISAIVDVAARLARGGDAAMIRLCMTQAFRRQDAGFVEVDLNRLESPADCREAVGQVVKDVSRGRVSLDNGKKLIDLIDVRRKSFDHFDDEIDYDGQRANYEFQRLCSQFPIDIVYRDKARFMDGLHERVFELPLSLDMQRWIWRTYLEGLEYAAQRFKEIEAEEMSKAEKAEKQNKGQ